jgi:hypothetical protein
LTTGFDGRREGVRQAHNRAAGYSDGLTPLPIKIAPPPANPSGLANTSPLTNPTPSFTICSTMSMPSALPADPPLTDADPWRAALARQVEMLGRLAEAGLEMAMALRDQIVGDAAGARDGADAQEIGLAFSRVSRAVRLTLALQAKVIEDIRALDSGAAPKAAAPAEARRERVRGVVERAILAEHGGGREFERLSRCAERLIEDEDLYGDLLSRPMSETVHGICRDLGLSPDWTRLVEETWAQREIAGGAVGEPLKDPEGFTAATPAAKAKEPIRWDVRWLGEEEDST